MFLVELAHVLTMSTVNDFVEIKIPISFVKNGAEFVAQWNDDYASSWTFTTDTTHNIMRIRAPKTKNINANQRYTLNVTTLNGLSEINGWMYPLTQGIYIAEIRVFKANVMVQESTTNIYVF